MMVLYLKLFHMIIFPCQLVVCLCLLHPIMVGRMSVMLMVSLILTSAVMLLWWKVLGIWFGYSLTDLQLQDELLTCPNFLTDRRKSSLNPITTIAAINLSSGDVQGKTRENFITSTKLDLCLLLVMFTQVWCLFVRVSYIFSILKNQRCWSVAMTSMLFLALIKIKSGWHGLSGVIQTCPGINQNSGLAISLKAGKCHIFWTTY